MIAENRRPNRCAQVPSLHKLADPLCVAAKWQKVDICQCENTDFRLSYGQALQARKHPMWDDAILPCVVVKKSITLFSTHDPLVTMVPQRLSTSTSGALKF
jgi:hypothetical protein